MTIGRLPPSLFPVEPMDLIRLGSPLDGGYLVERRSVQRAGVLVSLGISSNWQFEEDFLKLSPVRIIAYDDRTGLTLLLRETIKVSLRFLRKRGSFAAVRRSANGYARYRDFFSGSNVHHKQRIGLESEGNVSLKEVFSQIDPNMTIFLKMDIEGSEYDVLSDIIEFKERICGMAIEFHNVDQKIDEIKEFVAATGLDVAHIHANNYCGVTVSGVPIAIEISLTRDAVPVEGKVMLPHPLDRPNNDKIDEVILKPDNAYERKDGRN